MELEYFSEPLKGEYCMLTGARCAHLPVKVILNSFFIAEPFDSDRMNREAKIKAVSKALRFR